MRSATATIVFAVLLLVVSACGGGGPGGDASRQASSEATAAAVATAESSPGPARDGPQTRGTAVAAAREGPSGVAGAAGAQPVDDADSHSTGSPNGSTGGSPDSGDPTSAPPPQAPPRRLVLIAPTSVGQGDSAQLSVRLAGEPTALAAFNFDIVYDQTLVSLAAPEAETGALNVAGRTFQCSLPPPSGDVDPDPKVGRARLVCFSFGGPQAAAPSSPITIATVELEALKRGTATLTFENVAFFRSDGSPIEVAPRSSAIRIE